MKRGFAGGVSGVRFIQSPRFFNPTISIRNGLAAHQIENVMSTVVAVFIVLVIVARLVLERWLAERNLAFGAVTPNPLMARYGGVSMTPEAVARAVGYRRARTRFGHAGASLEAAVLVVLLFSGVLPAAWNGLVGQGWDTVAAGAGVMAVLLIFLAVVQAPLAWYETFRIEAVFGFSRTSPALFWSDRAKGVLLELALGLPLFAAVGLLAEHGGAWWWLIAAAVVIAFQLLATVLYPLLILPWFNRCTPLEGELLLSLKELAHDCNFPTEDMYVVDSSRRTRHSNAFVTGLGRTRRIMLYDTLIDLLDRQEIKAVIAHEIGHSSKRHLVKLTFLVALLLAAGFWVAGKLLYWPAFMGAFGFEAGAVVPGVLVLVLAAGPLLFWLAPGLHLIQRHFERQADLFAMSVTYGPGPLISALAKISANSLEILEPHPWYSLYHNTHPTLAERLAVMERVQRQIKGPV